ncbi:helix-turn-helix DNA binding domain protein [Microbacterium phage Fransoyer]|nr:helix-turn-helix DNA binding domain protein [Microbacterium phage RubyRalph]QUE25566.1 helix-turn-helix DNA binding domain protein [Microbacterium phage SadLad]UUG69583.1 helix-turn-helix DNA binding domain protein [Microbacterium phage Fransoyer]
MPDVNRLDFEKGMSKAEQRRTNGNPVKPQKPLKERIPRLPDEPRVDPSTITTADQRAIACANMRLAGAPFHEIAKELGYADASSAKSAYISALASMNPVEDLETLRQSAALRAEILFRQSLGMASADYLVDEEGNRLPNTEKLRWHEQASKDLNLLTVITGAKAPARVEVNASTQEMSQMVHLLVQANGMQDAEADVWQVSEMEAIEADIVEED